eukprot:704568-Amphidinium_carterae.1
MTVAESEAEAEALDSHMQKHCAEAESLTHRIRFEGLVAVTSRWDRPCATVSTRVALLVHGLGCQIGCSRVPWEVVRKVDDSVVACRFIVAVTRQCTEH